MMLYDFMWVGEYNHKQFSMQTTCKLQKTNKIINRIHDFLMFSYFVWRALFPPKYSVKSHARLVEGNGGRARAAAAAAAAVAAAAAAAAAVAAAAAAAAACAWAAPIFRGARCALFQIFSKNTNHQKHMCFRNVF